MQAGLGRSGNVVEATQLHLFHQWPRSLPLRSRQEWTKSWHSPAKPRPTETAAGYPLTRAMSTPKTCIWAQLQGPPGIVSMATVGSPSGSFRASRLSFSALVLPSISSSFVPGIDFQSPDLNVLLVFIPVAWVSHFHHWGEKTTFGCECHRRGRGVRCSSEFWLVCFLAIIPLEKLFDWCGDQMSLFLGSTLGDLLAITLNNAVEATLAIILLLKCE